MAQRSTQRGVVYLRRSTSRQEASLETQIDWAIKRAAELKVSLDASKADLDHMLEHDLSNYKSIYLDNGITGADLQRPGLTAVVAELNGNKQSSHLFAFKRDRLGRPDDPLAMMTIESNLSRNGVTIVFDDQVVQPNLDRSFDIGGQIKSLVDYYQSGEYLKLLAQRVLTGQRLYARDGHAMGGRPPYGFGRFLVGPDGEVVEELPHGKTVRQPGYHVRWLPKDEEKIAIWIMILEMKERGLGLKRIAQELNARNIPSPAAGSQRTDSGVKHTVSGKWTTNTVAGLCRNPLIAGIKEFGRRSMGHHSRVAPDGHRLLADSDYTVDGQPRVIRNEGDAVIASRDDSAAKFDLDRWQQIQQNMEQRSTCQKGVRRAKDPAKYPLSCRVVDLTDGCGSLMYGMTHGNRRIYKCGRYQKSASAECHNNTVDGEAMLQFLLKTLSNLVDRVGGRERLRELLEERAARQKNVPSQAESELARIDQQISQLESKVQIAAKNIAFEEDESIKQVIRELLLEKKQELTTAEEERKRLASSIAKSPAKPSDQVEAALGLLDQISTIVKDPAARAEIPQLLQKLGIWVGLNFVEAIKGKKRKVRRLLGGQICFGGYHLPVPLHGTDNRQASPGCKTEECSCGDPVVSGTLMGDACCDTAGNLEPNPREAISLTKRSRAERI